MKECFRNFKNNFKKYIDYLMTVNFGELFINVLILICIILLATFVFLPIGLIGTVIIDFIQLFGSLPMSILSIYNWLVNLISTILALMAFVYLFNKRFADMEFFKRQIANKETSNSIEKKDFELELPKTKDKK